MLGTVWQRRQKCLQNESRTAHKCGATNIIDDENGNKSNHITMKRLYLYVITTLKILVAIVANGTIYFHFNVMLFQLIQQGRMRYLQFLGGFANTL